MSVLQLGALDMAPLPTPFSLVSIFGVGYVAGPQALRPI